MNNLVCAAIMPHGDVIPELGCPEAEAMSQTHNAMLEVGRRMAAAKPDTIVIATPHGIRVENYISISLTQHAAGGLEGPGGAIIVDMPVNQHLAISIAQEAIAARIPVAGCTFGTSTGPESRLPLDWGAIIPLWYCGAQWDPRPNIIVVVPARSVSETEMVQFGRIVARCASRNGKRFGFIASCDWAHAHAASGPYGFHADAAKFDMLALDFVKSGRLSEFEGLDPVFVENAKPDGIWQALVLAGALEGSRCNVEVLSYQCPTYFGMLVAAYS